MTNAIIEALQLIANSNIKLADDKNVLKAQLMLIKSVAKEALSEFKEVKMYSEEDMLKAYRGGMNQGYYRHSLEVDEDWDALHNADEKDESHFDKILKSFNQNK